MVCQPILPVNINNIPNISYQEDKFLVTDFVFNSVRESSLQFDEEYTVNNFLRPLFSWRGLLEKPNLLFVWGCYHIELI